MEIRYFFDFLPMQVKHHICLKKITRAMPPLRDDNTMVDLKKKANTIHLMHPCAISNVLILLHVYIILKDSLAGATAYESVESPTRQPILQN